MRDEHDRRADRAIRAVNLLRDKYDWKGRVEVAEEEPEEWEVEGVSTGQQQRVVDEDAEMGSTSSEAEDDEVLENLGTGEAH